MARLESSITFGNRPGPRTVSIEEPYIEAILLNLAKQMVTEGLINLRVTEENNEVRMFTVTFNMPRKKTVKFK